MTSKNLLALTGLTILGVGMSAGALADTRAQINSNVTDTLTQFHALNHSNKDLSDKAAGALVFPRVTKGGAGLAAEYGEGALQVDGKTVGYYSMGSGSVGLTLGLAKRSEIILFMTKESLDKFTTGKGWSIGADAGITVMNSGASGEYDSQTQRQPVLAFAFGEKGLIGDLSLEGSKISKIKK
jgi:lipid-binding SYLF domain-containing protein